VASVISGRKMMIMRIGNMWDVFGDGNALWIFTGNGCTNKQGSLVMGRGLALDVKRRIPQIAKFFGLELIRRFAASNHYGIPAVYGLLTCGTIPTQRIGLLQVKRHFKERADLCLVGYSLTMLKGWMLPTDKIHVNFPAIGYGQRTEAEVLPLLQEFDDRLTVWKFPPSA